MARKLIVIDIGNTSIDIGFFSKEDLQSTAKISTKDNKSEFEISSSIMSLLKIKKGDLGDLEIIISSVVPNKTQVVVKASKLINSKDPIVVNHDFEFPIINKYNPPEDVGIDRIVDSIAATMLYGAPCVILDIGTCLVFNGVSSKKEYLGGSILPGLTMAADILANSTALLKPVELKIPKNLIGKNTNESIQSGIIFGYIELIKGIFEKYKKSISEDHKTPLIITGGAAELIIPNLDIKHEYNEHLSFIGLKYIYELQKST